MNDEGVYYIMTRTTFNVYYLINDDINITKKTKKSIAVLYIDTNLLT